MIAGYVRVSTQRQADEGVSIEMQKNLIAKHAHMIEILGKNDDIVFYVDDGFSGSSLQRPKMVELIEDMKRGKISVLLAYDLSRISRDLFDSNSFMKIARKYGVVIKCIYDDIEIETAANRFSTNIKILTNQYERERVIERTNDSLVSIADSGRYPAGGKPPFGYYRDPDKMVCIDEHDSKIVVKIFEMMKKGYDIKDVVSYLGFETDKLKANKDTVLRLVQNTKYIGIYKFKGKEYDDLIPPIIDKKTFEIVNRSFKKIEVKKDDNYLFDGMVFCEKCGCMTKCSHSINHQGKKYYYYVCYSCKKSVSQSTLEKHLFSVHIHHNDKQEYKDLLMKNVKNVKSKMKRVKDKYLSGQFNEAKYFNVMTMLEEELFEIQYKLVGINLNIEKDEYKNLVLMADKKQFIQMHIKLIMINLNNKKISKIELIE